MKRAPIKVGASSSVKDDKYILAKKECPSSLLCLRFRSTEDACVHCRKCFRIFNAHLEPNAYAGRGRA